MQNLPSPQDSQQLQRLLKMLYEEGDYFHVMAYPEKGVSYPQKGKPQDLRFTFCSSQLDNITGQILERNAMKLGVATSVASFETGQRRKEQFCAKLRALAVDLDDENLKALAPDAKSVEEAGEVLVARLTALGLPPHAIVSSGHGLHVYLRILPVMPTSGDDRMHVKGIWLSLGRSLGGATDRYDLASVMRLPGTTNWKNEAPQTAHFLDKFTDELRPPYSLSEIERVVGCEKAGKRRTERAGPRPNELQNDSDGSTDEPAIPLQHIREFQNLLDAALQLDKVHKQHTPNLKNSQRLNHLRAQTRDSDPAIDHSEADYAYACRLFECGMPSELVATELRNGVKAGGRADADYYSRHTLEGTKDRVLIAANPIDSRHWEIATDLQTAIHKDCDGCSADGHIPQLFCEEIQSTPEPVRVNLEPPGNGKTHVMVERFTGWFGSGSRTIVLGEFKRELLQHEVRINSLHPGGREYMSGPQFVCRDIDVPKTNEGLLQVLKFPIGSAAYKAAMETSDPAGFYLNTRHPLVTDERRIQDDEEDFENALRYAANEPTQPRKSEKIVPPPFAVVKFRGTPEYCLAGHSTEVLNARTPPCGKNCPHTSCRANATTFENLPRGAKTFWKDAAVALLTHQGFAVQAALKPEANHCDELWTDELPQCVFRRPTLTVKRVNDSRGVSWSVWPLDHLISFAEDVRKEGAGQYQCDLTAIIEKLRCRQENLVKQAQKRAKQSKQGEKEKKPAYNLMRVARIEPLLSRDEFVLLGKLGRKLARESAFDDSVMDEELPADHEGSSEMQTKSPHAFAEALCVLADFCEVPDSRLDVLLWFGKAKNEPVLKVVRPVNGWKELLGPSTRRVTILDASAGIDPRYLLAGQFAEEQFPKAEFPNTRVVLVPPRCKTGLKARSAIDKLTLEIKEQVVPYLNSEDRLLIITSQEIEGDFRGRVDVSGYLPCREVQVAHFGNLRGRNDFKDCTAVYFTHPHRYDPSYYTCLGLLVDGFQSGRGKAEKTTAPDAEISSDWSPQNAWKRWDTIVARAMVSDIYQDALRIRIRTDRTAPAHIFLPTYDSAIVIRLMRLLPGAGFEVLDGPQLRSARGDEWKPRSGRDEGFTYKVTPGAPGLFFPVEMTFSSEPAPSHVSPATGLNVTPANCNGTAESGAAGTEPSGTPAFDGSLPPGFGRTRL
jgi:hypothetical protein